MLPTDAEGEEEFSLPSLSPSNQEKLGLAILALATPALGFAMGGKQGALMGASAGLGAGGQYLNNKAEAQNKAEAAAAAKRQDMADFETKTRRAAEIKSEFKEPKVAGPELRSVGSDLVEYDPTTKKATTVFKGEGKAKDDKTIADPKEVRDRLYSSRREFETASKPYQTALDNAKSTAQLADLAKNNPRAAGAIVGKLARAAGEVGVLSDSDISRLGGSQSVQERLERFSLLSTSNQKLTEEDIRSAQELAAVMSESAQGNIDDLAERSVTSFTGIYGGDPEDIRVKITGRKGAPAQKKDAAPKAAPHGEAVVQDGVTYTWNPKTEAYE